jgi:predicted nucleic acid-binding protein
MIVVTDSNIIFSALIRPTGSEAVIFKSKSEIQFFAPAHLLEEIKVHWTKISEFTTLDNVGLRAEFEFLKGKLQLVHISEIPEDLVRKAYGIVQDIDEDDTYFVAMHLFTGHRIWTGDTELVKGLKKKGYDICITTAELRGNLYKR